MAIPLTAILAAAPGVISAATDLIGMIRKKQSDSGEAPVAEDARLADIVDLIEKQAQVIEELAQANQQLALAVRNNRIITLLAVVMAFSAIGVALFL